MITTLYVLVALLVAVALYGLGLMYYAFTKGYFND